MDFVGKHVLITGGSSGIGLAVALRLASRGASLSLVARDPARLSAAAGEARRLATRPGQAVQTASADVSQADAVRGAVAELTASLGPVDVLVASAGITHPGYFEELGDEVFRQMMDVDYFGTLWAVRAVVPSMIERRTGSLIAISSGAGQIGVFGYSAYSPAKFAVRGLMEALSQELRPYGIHVGVAYPPDTETPGLAYENGFKPLETRMIAGSIKPISADRMARAIVEGIEKRRYTITADVQSLLLDRIGGLVEPLLLQSLHGAVLRARRKRGLSR